MSGAGGHERTTARSLRKNVEIIERFARKDRDALGASLSGDCDYGFLYFRINPVNPSVFPSWRNE
jgi:hypothetical protein